MEREGEGWREMERDGELNALKIGFSSPSFSLVSFARRQSSVCVNVQTLALFGCVQKCVHDIIVLITIVLYLVKYL